MRAALGVCARSLCVAALVAMCAAASSVAGQTRDARIIAAHAGVVNYVSGDVSVRLEGQTEWRSLTAKDTLATGDVLKTSALSHVELLLNPGSYLRLGENSEFVLDDDSLESLRLKLSKGSAVVEATGFDGLSVEIALETPQAQLSIVRSGIYRVNVLPETKLTEIVVEKGRAMLGATKLRGNTRARIGAGGVELSKFEKKSRDEFDLWSRERGQMLAQANRKLTQKTMNALIASSMFDNFWNSPSNGMMSGLWFFNSSSRCYTFLPFSPRWGSPYGFGYTNIIWGGSPYPIPCTNCHQAGYGNQVNYPRPINTGNGAGMGTGMGAGAGSGGSISSPNPFPVNPPSAPMGRGKLRDPVERPERDN